MIREIKLQIRSILAQRSKHKRKHKEIAPFPVILSNVTLRILAGTIYFPNKKKIQVINSFLFACVRKVGCAVDYNVSTYY